MAASSLSLLPSPLTFPPSDRFSTSSSSSASSPSFFHSGTHLRFHRNFTSLHSCFSIFSPFPPNSQFNKRVSSKRGIGFVVSASGDYYATLRIPKSADSKEIKAAYRKLARQANFNDKYEEYMKKWGGGIMGSKSQAKTKAKERVLAKEAAQRMS